VGGSRIYVSGSAGLKYLFKPMNSVDPILCGLAKEFVSEGCVVWDIGANVGLFSFAAAHLTGENGQVLAFEADSWLVPLLRRSAAIQPKTSGPVQIVPVAIANSCDLRTFNIAHRSRASNSLAGYGHSHAGGVEERQTVIAVSIDWLARRLALPDVVKIDVEGAELEVLEGGIEMLKDRGPVIICEVCAAKSVPVATLLRGLGYKIFDGDAPKSERRELTSAPWNTVAIRG
jgi:FkbM family methyltransferase